MSAGDAKLGLLPAARQGEGSGWVIAMPSAEYKTK